MKRRKFAQSIAVGLGLGSLPMGASMSASIALSQPVAEELQLNASIKTLEGLKLKLKQKIHPTKNKDNKQYILTYDVVSKEGEQQTLDEKIYHLSLSNGQTQMVYMTPVNETQLQAVFNRRLNV